MCLSVPSSHYKVDTDITVEKLHCQDLAMAAKATIGSLPMRSSWYTLR